LRVVFTYSSYTKLLGYIAWQRDI